MTIHAAPVAAIPTPGKAISTQPPPRGENTDNGGFGDHFKGFTAVSASEVGLPPGTGLAKSVPPRRAGEPRDPGKKINSQSIQNVVAWAPQAAEACPTLPLTLAWPSDGASQTQEKTGEGRAEIGATLAAYADPSSEAGAPSVQMSQPNPANGPARVTEDLAFAARIQPGPESKPAGANASVKTASAAPTVPPAPNRSQHDFGQPEQSAASAVKKAAPDAAKDGARTPDPLVLPSQGATTPSDGSGEVTTSQESQRPAGTTALADTQDPKAESQPKPAQALKDISFQVTQSSSQKVQVRLVEQSGELRVAVHSGDSDLAHGLRQGLPDLIGRLQETGFRTEAWRPSSAGPVTGPTPETRSSDNHSSSGDSQSQSGWSQQDRGQQNQNHSNRPRWVEELESSLTSGGKSAGGSYGITS